MWWCSSTRDVVLVEGPDAVSYLHSQLSQDVAALAVGASAWSFLLQPTGKVDALVRVWRVAEDLVVVDTDAGFGEVMTARLNRFKIRVKAEIERVDWQCIAVRDVDGSPPTGSVVGWGGGFDLLGADIEPPVGASEGSGADLTDARIAAGWPAMGSEITPGSTIPAETGVIDAAVSFTKGCYPGQELVERMDSRGAEAPRRLVVVPLAGRSVGDDIVVEGRAVGVVTSIGRTHALALVRRGTLS